MLKTTRVMACAAALALQSTVWACGGDSPIAPSQDSLSVSLAQASGTTLTIPQQYPTNSTGGVVMPQGASVISVTVKMQVGHDIPWAQLNVYLLTGNSSDQYCGQNLPDSPTWQFLKPGWQQSVTVTGFQIYRLPCEVTGVRAMLHMRNGGLLVPPNASETVAQNILPTTLRLVR